MFLISYIVVHDSNSFYTFFLPCTLQIINHAIQRPPTAPSLPVRRPFLDYRYRRRHLCWHHRRAEPSLKLLLPEDNAQYIPTHAPAGATVAYLVSAHKPSLMSRSGPQPASRGCPWRTGREARDRRKGQEEGRGCRRERLE
ncbi:hypothetical protein BC938DRAFT_482623 [Jimgerdemannia flammicorona]|uniref:Uncharacterized protein n=1 Tax=Jimgerdemannia flammicorona TaxID=994334 RepID=A0A433QDQ7_9FUNG|nr:hypothetical protein BC938DRAFT_482623 [Jimgerdemannia flammicorona]